MSAALLRQAASAARNASRPRPFSTTVVSRKDLVQDLYLKELKAYKPVPPAKDAHVGAVKTYSLPPAPKAPSLPSDLASELAAYDAAQPSKVEAKTETSSGSEGGAGAEAFLHFLEQDIPKAQAHH